MPIKYYSASTYESGDVDNVITIPPQIGKKIVITSLRVVGGSAGSDIRVMLWNDKGKTTTNTAAAANDGDLQLAGDTGANDTLNGAVYAANDWVLVKLDSRRYLDALNSWQMMEIAGVGGATSGTIDITSVTAADGENDPVNAVASGNPAYVMLAEDGYTELIGAATKVFGGGKGSSGIFQGSPGNPVSLHLEAAGATVSGMQVTAKYV